MNSEEIIIIDKIKKGDKQIFRKLYQVYYQRMILYARSYVDNSNTAEDIVQDLFFHLWEKREDVTITTSFSSYLFRAVHNRCIQFLRHRKVEHGYKEFHQIKIREAEIMYYCAGDYSFSENRLNEIQKIIQKTYLSLPQKTNTIFSLSRKDFLSNTEIAQKLNINIKTVEYHITKALRAFREALSDFFILLVTFLSLFA